tara:strand:- start:354 stop:530 length:177 start_codon:yes stop_codon:yes gene_type:complete
MIIKQGMTPSEVRKFYRDQLKRFERIGIGNKTDNGVVVTDILIEATKRRLMQLNGGLK